MSPQCPLRTVPCGHRARSTAIDAEDLEAWRAGDRDAGARLLTRYHREMLGYFQRRAPDRAEDLTQQTLLACIERRDEIRDVHGFRYYLYGIAWRTYLRSGRGHESVPLDDEVPCGPATADAEARYDATRLRHTLVCAIEEASPVNRRALELYYLEGCRSREVAQALRIPPATVRSRLVRGVAMLRRRLAGHAMP